MVVTVPLVHDVPVESDGIHPIEPIDEEYDMTSTVTDMKRTASRRPMNLPRWAWRFPEMVGLPGERWFRIEELRDDHCTIIRAELPGMSADDLEVTTEDDVLTIRAERRTSESQNDQDRVHSEFHYGMFERRMPLPDGSHIDQITADYDAGILEIRIPMDGDRPKAHRIAVETHNG